MAFIGNAAVFHSSCRRNDSIPDVAALAVSQMNGGLPAITSLFVMITGLLGIILGPVIFRIFRIQDDIARCVLLGTSAHTAGTSKVFEFSSVSGSISSIVMILTAFFTRSPSGSMRCIAFRYTLS